MISATLWNILKIKSGSNLRNVSLGITIGLYLSVSFSQFNRIDRLSFLTFPSRIRRSTIWCVSFSSSWSNAGVTLTFWPLPPHTGHRTPSLTRSRVTLVLLYYLHAPCTSSQRRRFRPSPRFSASFTAHYYSTSWQSSPTASYTSYRPTLRV